MDREEVRRKIEEAKQLVGGDPQDPFTQIAFKEVLRILLCESTQPEVAGREKKTVADIRGMRVSEFLAQRRIVAETDRVVAILYHQFHNGQESGTRAEILEAYSAARIRRPTNLSDVIARCIRKGLVIEAPEKKDGHKAWQITQSGERYVEEDLRPELK